MIVLVACSGDHPSPSVGILALEARRPSLTPQVEPSPVSSSSMTNPGKFNELTEEAHPSVDQLDPTQGNVGDSVIITGSNFIENETTVTFGEGTATPVIVPASDVTVSSSTELSVEVPVGAVDGPLKVETPFGSAISTEVFDVIEQVGPTIDQFDPIQASVGDLVIMTGTNFIENETTVTFGDETGAPVIVPANNVTVSNSTELSVVVPVGTVDGFLKVETPFGSAISTEEFDVTLARADDFIDLVIVNRSSNSVSFVSGDGTGEFSNPVITTAGTLPRSVVVGDWNRDGKLDYAATSTGSEDTVLSWVS